MKRYAICFLGVCCLASLSFIAGCQPSDSKDSQASGHGHDHDHDHGGRPKSLRAAIQELTELRDQLRTAMEEDDTKAAHEPLHTVGKLLKAMPDLAADTDLPEAEWDELKKHVDELFDAFGDIDAAFHKKDGDKQAAYDAAKSTVDEGVAALEALLPKLGGDESSDGHDHDHEEGDHDDHEDHDHAEHDEEAKDAESAE